MKNTNCLREFAKYTSLNITGMLSLSCYILVDTFFVSVGLGANGLAALNFAIPVYGFIIGISLMLGIGGATKYAILKSQNDKHKANQAFTITVYLMLAAAFIFFTAGLFFSHTVTRIFGTDETVFEMTRTYLQIILLFSPIMILQHVMSCFVRNDGAPQLAMIAMVSGSLSNIILDYVFIILLEMGMFGAALATGLASIISVLILSSFYLRKKNCFHLTKCKVSRRFTGEILGTGLPSLVTELSVGVVMIVFNRIILQLEGYIGVAAYGVIANIAIIVLAIYTGIAQGIQPIISSNYGSGNTANVRAILRYALILLTVISAAVYMGVFLGTSQIVSIFNSEQNAALQSVATQGMKLYFIACIFAGFNIIMSFYFTSTECARPAQIISILRGFLLIIPMIFLLSALGGITGVWLAFPATEFITSLTGLALYIFYQGKRKPLNRQL